MKIKLKNKWKNYITDDMVVYAVNKNLRQTANWESKER